MEKVIENCITCHWATKFESFGKEKWRCWEHPDVCDHAHVMTTSEAMKEHCDHYKNRYNPICNGCKYLGVQGCMNINNAVIKDEKIILKDVDYDDEACEHRKENEK